MSHKAKHTPGPWVNAGKFGEWPNESFHVELRSETTTAHVAVIDVPARTREARERADANAHLIAAVPDADRILRRLLEYIEAGEPGIQFDGLMPDDGCNSNIEDQTLREAVECYFAKAAGR